VQKYLLKITIIENILDKIDHLIIGGGMTFTFIKAQDGNIGNSLVEEDKQELALEILSKAKKKNSSSTFVLLMLLLQMRLVTMPIQELFPLMKSLKIGWGLMLAIKQKHYLQKLF